MKNLNLRKKNDRKGKEKNILSRFCKISWYSMIRERKKVMGEIGIVILFITNSIQRMDE